MNHSDGVPNMGPMKQRSSVSFANDSIRIIPSVDEYSSRERDSMWYTSKEFDHIRERCFQEVQQLLLLGQEPQLHQPEEKESDQDLSPNQRRQLFTSRGLECIAHDGLSLARQANGSYVLAVLQEQDRLREKMGGVVDPEHLALVHQRGSSHRLRMAHLMALRDAQEIRDEHDDDLCKNHPPSHHHHHHYNKGRMSWSDDRCSSSTGINHDNNSLATTTNNIWNTPALPHPIGGLQRTVSAQSMCSIQERARQRRPRRIRRSVP
jgi:hypothetical protein